jgi:hypothetical protein
VLPQSEAPGIRRLRSELHGEVKALLLEAGDADALLRFADTDHGREDRDVWAAAARLLPPASPRRQQVAAQLAALDRELGIPVQRVGGARNVAATSA